jgi:hypothetical protein
MAAMTMLNDSGWVLWKFAGGQIETWQIGELRKMLRVIYSHHSDDEIGQTIFRYLIPDDYVARRDLDDEGADRRRASAAVLQDAAQRRAARYAVGRDR